MGLSAAILSASRSSTAHRHLARFSQAPSIHGTHRSTQPPAVALLVPSRQIALVGRLHPFSFTVLHDHPAPRFAPAPPCVSTYHTSSAISATRAVGGLGDTLTNPFSSPSSPPPMPVVMTAAHSSSSTLPGSDSAAQRPNFYDTTIEEYARKKPTRLSIRQMLHFGRDVDATRLIEAARYLHREMPTRLAHRLWSLQHLPFIVGRNPYIQSVYESYALAFRRLIGFPAIKSLADEARFVELVKELLDSHNHVVVSLASAAAEISKYLTQSELNEFLHKMLVTRISRRALAEHHIALHNFFRNKHSRQGYVGIIRRDCAPAAVVRSVAAQLQTLSWRTYGRFPAVIVEGHLDATFAYIQTHLEYILQELLKNSMTAVIESHAGKSGSQPPDLFSPVAVATGGGDASSGGSVDLRGINAAPELLGLTPPHSKPSVPSSASAAAASGASTSMPVDAASRFSSMMRWSQTSEETAVTQNTFAVQSATLAGLDRQPFGEPGATATENAGCDPSLPPIIVTVCKGDQDLTIRIRDLGGGIHPEDVPRVWDYGFSKGHYASEQRQTPTATTSSDTNTNTNTNTTGASAAAQPSSVAEPTEVRRGFGLPVSRAYTEYLGGSLHLESMHGYGVDVYIKLNHLGDNMENVRI
ncbi:branched chain alpha-ketoacid dehydrogenase kinase [Capsaspora owczarzaki ATCC 30864]|uniref:Protein-serine/threonine kinase n=1 Tax=Capsaspora owczarzaki (strain ATCC 30864) TaxID=595528 RepID=A0A0D2UMA1_CAPO3|nr:branched chain alpha-ketoacid dehydrogenase kinase [Capsaspora owczarzaki ATCC 30864]KJE96191.1 branched chain alpha-ketoacid dehydrogenase kinase [Capsaspora owczarzaki ATCC 30864]|eukprot:XP_004345299.1 branched chain alpha-ketoacid dehydrogenase kinase [Capsaspora owczarzaki ATCC 30864]